MEFIIGTVLALLGIAVTVFIAVRSRQLSHPDFELRVGEHSIRSGRRPMNPKHLIYLVSLGKDFNVNWFQLHYAIRNVSKRSLHRLNITIDVPTEFCIAKSRLKQVLTEAGVPELAESGFIKSRAISSYLNLKRVTYEIDSLGPKQVSNLAEVLNISDSRVPAPIPVPITMNSIFKCMEEHEEIRAFIPIHMSVSAQDIEPKTETFFVALIQGDFGSFKSMPRGKRKEYSDGEYEQRGLETSAESLGLQNYINSFWLGRWPAGMWRSTRLLRMPWQRNPMMRSEQCHIVPIDQEILKREEELKHPHFSGEIGYYPISVPNFDYLSTEFNFESPDEIMEYLGFRRPYRYEEMIRRILFASYIVVVISLFVVLSRYF